MSILSTNNLRRLSLGFSTLDDGFPGFELGDFAVLRGNAASFLSFVLSVRSQLPPERGGLGSSTVFVDGGNLFSPYSVAEIARGYDLDYQEVLDKVYVSRAFTAYQLSSLVLEKLYCVLRRTRARLLVVSDITSLFMDRDVPKAEARELFMRVCPKLVQTALEEHVVVAVSYFPDRRSRQGLFFEAILFGKCSVLVKLKRKSGFFTFVLEDHPRFKPFTTDFEAVQASSAVFHGGVRVGENSSIL